MIKPKMAEGSHCYGALVETSNGTTLQIDCEGDLHIEDVDDFSARPSPLDVIRALAAGGQLPLWNAAVAVVEAVRTRHDPPVDPWQHVGKSIAELCRVVDEMKEPTP